MKNLHAFTGHRERTKRYFATYRIGGDDQKRIEGHLEIPFLKKVSPGFLLHLGDRGSETPVDIMVSFYWVAFFFSMNFPGLGKFCEWIGRGHKRNIGLRFHNSMMWWELWYDDEGGYDEYHKCDSWRRPKLYPWRWGRKKHRPWMCLRSGNLELNPIDAFWGHRYFSYEDVEKQDALLHVNEFPRDNYLVHFTLQKQTRARRYGPKWARRVTEEGYVADWESQIPIRNHSWKGDDILGSAERVDYAPGCDWVGQALDSLKARTKKDRRRYNYRPPEEYR